MRPTIPLTTTARLVGGPAAGQIVDLAIHPGAGLHPSDQILVHVYEGAAVAIDQLPEDHSVLLADGWIRYRRAPAIPPQGQPWRYVGADE